MTTNEERREVARRLRMLASHREVDKDMFHDAIGVWPGGCLDGYDPVSVMELADLIEPEPERTVMLTGGGLCPDCRKLVGSGERYCAYCGAKAVGEEGRAECSECGAEVVKEQ